MSLIDSWVLLFFAINYAIHAYSAFALLGFFVFASWLAFGISLAPWMDAPLLTSNGQIFALFMEERATNPQRKIDPPSRQATMRL